MLGMVQPQGPGRVREPQRGTWAPSAGPHPRRGQGFVGNLWASPLRLLLCSLSLMSMLRRFRISLISVSFFLSLLSWDFYRPLTALPSLTLYKAPWFLPWKGQGGRGSAKDRDAQLLPVDREEPTQLRAREGGFFSPRAMAPPFPGPRGKHNTHHCGGMRRL